MKRLLLLAVIAAAVACSTPDPEDAPIQKKPLDPTVAYHARPFVTHFDAVENHYLPHGEFPPGVECVVAPIYSSANVTLYFLATRTRIPRYVDVEHEETIFITSGEGTLDLSEGRSRHVEGGFLVRVPPRFARGLTPAKTEPLEAIIVATPGISIDPGSKVANDDLPDATGILYCADVTDPSVLPSPDRPSFVARKCLDESKLSSCNLVAVQRDRINDHRHARHDETVIMFSLLGLGFLRTDEVVDPVQAIEIAHIPAGTVHSFEHKAEGQARAISIFTPGGVGDDTVAVQETRELQAPADYKKTSANGDWIEDGRHARQGDSVAPRAQDPIRGVGNDAGSH